MNGKKLLLQRWQSLSPSLRSSGRNVRLWDNPKGFFKIAGAMYLVTTNSSATFEIVNVKEIGWKCLFNVSNI
jgi:hypothetical protein